MTLPRNLLEMHILRPHPDLLNQTLWEWDPLICVEISPPGQLVSIKVTALGALKNSHTHSLLQRSWSSSASLGPGHLCFQNSQSDSNSYHGEALPWGVQSPAVLLRGRSCIGFLLPTCLASPNMGSSTSALNLHAQPLQERLARLGKGSFSKAP